MENKTGWKSPKRKANIIVGTEEKPTEFKGGEVIINKKATKKNLDRLIEINNDGSGKVTTDASDGGILKGKPHYDENGNPTGGIPGVVAGSKNIETEGGEFVVNPEASEKHWKELSEINQSTGGVPINNPNGFDDDPQEYSEGGKIKFNANKLPKSSILNYAEMVRTKYPKVWDLGGNIFGNEAFKNLKRVSDRGYWTDNEEWMYIKWRSYVARHQKDFRIAGVIAMLKWVDTVDRGWAYMRKLIDEEIKKRYPKKMKEGGSIPKTKETYEVVVKISNISNPNEINGSGVKNKYKGAYKQIFNILNQDSILIEVESVDEILVGNDLYVFFENQFEADKYDKISKLKNVEIFETKFKLGGRTIAQTPAPKKDRVKGSKVNQVESSESLSKASSIKFSSKTLSSIKGKVEEHNESHPDKKITLASAKAVVRRGMGAYSSSHRPTITGGQPNDRTAWGLARLNAFTYKIVHGKSKSGKYTQDDDLINELGYSVSKYHLGGDMTKHLAPNGKPSNLTHEQWHLVRTPEFKAWFGDWENDPANASKVVDENGEPKVMYHGARAKFTIFSDVNENKLPWTKGGKGFYFTSLYNNAFAYGENVLACFIKANPIMSDGKQHAFVTEYDLNKIKSWGSDAIYFDGEILNTQGKWVMTADELVVFEPNQIKLADGSNTTFDGSNPDIRFKEGGKVKTKSFVVFFKSNYLNNIIYTNIDSDSLENAVKEQQSLYSWSDIAWIKGFEQKSANDLQEFFLQNIKEKWETKPELSVRIKNGKIFFNRNKDSVSFYFIPVFEVKDGVRIFKEGYLQHSTTEIYVDSAFNFDRNKIFELMLKRMADGGNIEYQSRNLSGSMVYYRRKGNEKWEFISKEEFDKNANDMNTIEFEGVMLSKLPDVVKKDALDIVLKGGYRYELDKLRNPHKKKFTNFSDEISLDVSYALIYAIFNGLITVENNPGNTHFWVYGYTVIHRDKEGIKEMMDENDFEKYIKLGIVTQNQVDKIIEESGNIQMKDGGLVDEIAKIKSEINHLYSKAFKMFPNSPKQKEVIKQIDDLRLKLESMGGKMVHGGGVMTNTEKLIQEITHNSNVEYGVISTTSDGEKYRYVRYRYKNSISPNWLVMLFNKAAEENGAKNKTQFFYKDYSFFYDRHPMKNMPNGSIGFKVLEILPSDFADGGPVDAKDTVTVDIPLMIRLLELSREDVNSDAELHMVVERLLDLKNKPVLTMDDYAYIAEIEHKHLKKMELGGNIENEKLISQAHTNLTVKKGRRDYAPTTIEIQEEIDRMIIEGQFGSSNV